MDEYKRVLARDNCFAICLCDHVVSGGYQVQVGVGVGMVVRETRGVEEVGRVMEKRI